MSVRLLAFCALALTVAPSQAQTRSADVVSWSARAEGGARGEAARVVFSATLAPGWKMYALDSPVGRPLSVSLNDLPAGVTAGTPRQTGARRGHDAAFDAEASTFVNTARIEQPLAVSRRAAVGPAVVSGTVRYAVCDAEICLPPAASTFRVTLRVQ